MSKDIKKKILDAVVHVRKNMGFTLISEDWGDASHKCACPMSCIILKSDADGMVASPAENATKAAQLLGVPEKWVDCFIEGFDGNGTADGSAVPEAWTIGNEVAKETKPIAYHLWDGESDD